MFFSKFAASFFIASAIAASAPLAKATEYVVYPGNDLNNVIANAVQGDIITLQQGIHSIYATGAYYSNCPQGSVIIRGTGSSPENTTVIDMFFTNCDVDNLVVQNIRIIGNIQKEFRVYWR